VCVIEYDQVQQTLLFLLHSKISNQRNFYYYLYELMR